jgi:hypothetical protein
MTVVHSNLPNYVTFSLKESKIISSGGKLSFYRFGNQVNQEKRLTINAKSFFSVISKWRKKISILFFFVENYFSFQLFLFSFWNCNWLKKCGEDWFCRNWRERRREKVGQEERSKTWKKEVLLRNTSVIVVDCD